MSIKSSILSFWKNIVTKLNHFILCLKRLLYKLLILLLSFLRYSSLLIFVGSIVYFAHKETSLLNIEVNTLKVENDNQEPISNFLMHWKSILTFHTEDFSLVKGYEYTVKNNILSIKTFHRIPTFLFQNKYYDKEGIVINEQLNNLDNICNVIGDNNQFLKIYTLFQGLDGKLNLAFNGMRWTVYLTIGGKKITIKLPIAIDAMTLKKIQFLKNNPIKDNVTIIDLRFADKIYFIE